MTFKLPNPDRFLLFWLTACLLVFAGMAFDHCENHSEKKCRQAYSPQGTAVLGYYP